MELRYQASQKIIVVVIYRRILMIAEEENWYENYSPIPLEKAPATLQSTLTPKEVVVAMAKNSEDFRSF
jgi:hypothetical protein